MKNNTTSQLPTVHKRPGWSHQELSELRRSTRCLARAGYNIEAGWGASDEGDPWFALIDESSNMPMLHITRLDNTYTALILAHPRSFHSRDLRTLLLETIQRLIIPIPTPHQKAFRRS